MIHYACYRWTKRAKVVIEKALRDALGIEPGYVAVQRMMGDHIELYFYPPEHNDSLLGALKGKVQIPKEEMEWARHSAKGMGNCIYP